MPPRLLKQGMPELFPQSRRSKGKHVSAAIFDIMQTLYPDKYDGSPIDITRANLGNAFEKTIARGLHEADPDRYAIPGELEHEDWYGTPDLWDTINQTTIEFKLTWYSLNRADDIEGEWAWRYWVQLKAYCHMAGMTKGRLYICFINGNYRRDDPDSGPTVRGWEDEWTKEELLENWNMLKARC